MDYRDHKPHLNAPLLRALVSGVGLRQAGRILPLSVRCTEMKARKIGRHLRCFNQNLRGPLQDFGMLQLGEIRSFETRKRTRPVAIALLIEATSQFHVWAQSATLRPRVALNQRDRLAIARDEQRFGKRRDRSRQAVLAVSRAARPLVAGHGEVAVISAQKTSRAGALRQVFGAQRLLLFESPNGRSDRSCDRSGSVKATFCAMAPRHLECNSAPRANRSPCLARESRFTGTAAGLLGRFGRDPLFPVRLAKAMARDSLGRLRRKSWLVSKKREILDLALQTYMAWRNCVRPRFNGERRTAAQLLGLTARPLGVEELLSWRQDFGRRAIAVPGALAHGGRLLCA